MVTAALVEGGTQILSSQVRKTIQSIKEIVGNHSDADIYLTLKETSMDPNETAQKLLNQDPFHEVRRKIDKKKEVIGYKVSTAADTRRTAENETQGMKFNSHSDHNGRRGAYNRNSFFGPSKRFRIIRDNRVHHNANIETKAPSLPVDERVISNVHEKSLTGTASKQGLVAGCLSQLSNGTADSQLKQVGDANSTKDSLEGKLPLVANAAFWVQAKKPNDCQSFSTASSNSSVVGLYSSSSDPVHVPSLDSRSPSNVGAIKREVGVVGGRRQSYENSAKPLSSQTSSYTNSQSGRDGFYSREPSRSFTAISKKDQPNQHSISESAVPSPSASRNILSSQYYSKPNQQLMGHQKAAHSNKEWKPKSGQKPNAIGPGVVGMPAKSIPSTNNPENSEKEAGQLQDKLSRVNISENQNVIIAAHIQVSETDLCRLTFGSLGVFEGSKNSGSKSLSSAEESHVETSASYPESESNRTSASKHVDLVDDHVRNSGSSSPATWDSEHQMADKKDSSSQQNFDINADIGLVQESSQSYNPSNSQQCQDTPELPSFSAYDPQTGYYISYFRPTDDEAVRGQGLPSPHEELSSQVHSIPASSTPMMQQQQPVAQMFPQVHVSHFANLMSYRQFLSPVYAPPLPVPGYSSNPTYPHLSTGSSYLLMPGGGSHLTAGGLKYGIQQFKPVPSSSPTGFGNFTNPAGYAINAPGVVGSASGLEDSSRLKYKDSSLYAPNPQAETSEIWMNPRDLPSMQSASYYNMTGQTPHGTYLPSDTGHASFNAAAVAQSSRMQFQGLYHPPQPAAIANPHHMGPAMGGNIGVGVAAAAPGAQVGGYQQPQLCHLNWTGNFLN